MANSHSTERESDEITPLTRMRESIRKTIAESDIEENSANFIRTPSKGDTLREGSRPRFQERINFESTTEKTIRQGNIRDQLCTLKYRCALSLFILMILLLETIIRRVEQSLQTNTVAYLNGTLFEQLLNISKSNGRLTI